MIIEHIDKHHLEKQVNKKARNGKLYVSEVGKCPCQIYFEFKGYGPEKRKPETQRAFENGDKFHQRMMAALYACPDIEVVASEIDIPPNDLVGGRVDAIVSIENRNYVLELKSIGSYGFKQLDEPRQEHVHQLQLYLHFFKIPKGILLYENKDNHQLKECVVAYNEELAKSLIAKLQRITDYIRADNPPLKPKFSKDQRWRCGYCGFKAKCREETFNHFTLF